MSKNLEQSVVQLKQGYQASFETIYAETSDLIFYVILGMVQDRNTAEELMQETYLKMHKHLKKYKSGSFTAWLVRIAKNTTINYIKKKKPVILESDDINFQSNSNTDELLLIHDMQNLLSESEMDIVMLHTISDYPHRKISEMLDIPLGTVTWKYKQAIEKLQKGLNI